ncbi:hypothetical protein [Arsenophonus sp. PmNCSU2021_1]|uniref:hypothetical protein n=1 Tax=Arsenophonus sp. PmNCSU2021_1 TaxID=3118989 RepID=UPI002FF06E16
MKNELSELSELADPYTEVHINNAAEKQVRGFIEGINKSISVVKVAEDKNGKDIWMRYDPITEKVFGRRYYRSEDYSDILEPIPLPLSERLNKIRTEGLSGKGSKEADRNMAAESSTSRKLLASVDEMTHSKPTEKLKLDKQKRSLNLNLSSSSSSVTTTDI